MDIRFSTAHDVVALIGENGSGKSTLLHILLGAVQVDASRIVVDGRTVEDTAHGIHVPIEDRRIGYVPQGYGLFPHLNVVDNVAFGPSARSGESRTRRRQRAMEVLQTLGCEELAMRSTTRLSGGEKQRVALARALVSQPDVLLLDEPLGSLDAATRREVRQTLADHLQNFAGPTIIVTHDAKDVAALEAHVVVLAKGKVAQRGSLDRLRSQPESDFVREFVT